MTVFALLFPLKKSNNAFSIHWLLGFKDTRKLKEEEAVQEAEAEQKEEVISEEEETSKPVAEGKLYRHKSK